MTYAEWITRYDTLTPEQREELRRQGNALPHQPLISVLLPVYNPDLRFLEEAISSVRRQLYKHWQLCIVDDASTDERVRPFLQTAARSDNRIQLFFRETNGHISACSNSALDLARGEWCALLDQDDALAERALVEVASAIAREPELNLLYSDEDFLDSLGDRFNPFFKPDWNPELFFGQNYLNHLGVYRTSLLRQIGGFRRGFEGSQDYDLALRCIARSRPNQIRHLPKILYHWRMAPGSLADKPDAKPYARVAARRALNSYLEAKGIAGRAEACPENDESHRVIYEVPSPIPSVTLVTTGESQSQLFEPKEYPDIDLLVSAPGAAAMNSAARHARGEVLVFLHDILAAEPGWLKELVSQVARREVGAVGARLWSPEGKLEDGALILGVGGVAAPAFRGVPRGHPGYFNRAWLQQDCAAVSGACLAIRKETFIEMDGFDETNLPVRLYDIDLCLRLRASGLRVIWTPYANLIFAGCGLREEVQFPAEVAYMQSRWREQLCDDPFYNPNLSLATAEFGLASPARRRQSSS